jgi:hypothetical protein
MIPDRGDSRECDPPHPRRDHSGQIGAVVGALISPSRSLEPIELTTLGTIHPLRRRSHVPLTARSGGRGQGQMGPQGR